MYEETVGSQNLNGLVGALSDWRRNPHPGRSGNAGADRRAEAGSEGTEPAEAGNSVEDRRAFGGYRQQSGEENASGPADFDYRVRHREQGSGNRRVCGYDNEELADAEEREEKQYALFCKRVRAMEEHGTEEYWAVLFRADSFSDLLGRLDIVNEIMDFDQRVIRDLKEIQAEITETKAQLEEQKAASESAKAQLVSKKTDLDNQRDAANALIAQLRAQQAEQEDAYDDLDAEADAVQARAQQLSRQLAAEQAEAERKRREAEAAARAAAAANGQNANTTTSVPASSGASNPGGYIWPVNSHYVTSTVGGRASPGGIGSTNHKGTDIGRVGYTSSVYAAKSGTVIISEYSRSYGNYIVISHGSGNTTLYAHMSKLIAKEGQQVSQGQVIGVTGSTGNSTGPHLHFEVSEGGVRIDPLKKGYLTGATIRNK